MRSVTLWCLLFISLLWLPAFICCTRIVRSVAGFSPYRGDNNLATRATLQNPSGIFYSNRQLYIADLKNNVIRMVNKNGVIFTVAGTSKPGMTYGKATNATLFEPVDVSVVNNTIYFIEQANAAIRKVNSETGEVELIAENLEFQGLLVSMFVSPWNGQVYYCNPAKHIVGTIFVNGTKSVFAGQFGQPGYQGDGGLAVNAQLTNPTAVFVTPNETFIADSNNRVIRKVFANGTITTVAKLGTSPSRIFVTEWSEYNELYVAFSSSVIKLYLNATNAVDVAEGEVIISGGGGYSGDYLPANSSAGVQNIGGISITPANEVFVSDSTNNVIRKVHVNGTITTFAGSTIKRTPLDPNLIYAPLISPSSVYVSSNQEIYIADKGLQVIKKVDRDGITRVIVGEERFYGFLNDCINTFATDCRLSFPTGVFLHEPTQQLYITDAKYVRKLDLQSQYITTVAGRRRSGSGGPIAIENLLYDPTSVFVTNWNELYFAEAGSFVIRRVFLENGTMETVVGVLGTFGDEPFSPDGSMAVDSVIGAPNQIYVHSQTGELYFSDSTHLCIRKVNTNGTLETVISKDESNNGPSGFTVNEETNELIFAKIGGIFKVSLYDYSMIELVSGNNNGVIGKFGDDGNATLAEYDYINSLFLAPGNTIYVTDSGNNLIRKIADLCQNYTFSPLLAVQNESTTKINILAQTNRTCANPYHFDANYLPLVEVNYKATNVEWDSFVLDWNQESSFSLDIVGQTLDILNVNLNSCNQNFVNCSFIDEYGVSPTVDFNNFAVLPYILSIDYFNFYRTSEFVQSFEIKLDFFNLNMNRSLERTVFVTNSRSNTGIKGLRPSTDYTLQTQTFVTYKNGLSLQSSLHFRSFRTGILILPEGNVGSLSSPSQTESSIILSWSEFEGTQGNLPITILEIAISTIGANFEITTSSNILLDYNVNANDPSSYMLNGTANTNYTIKIRACSEGGCGPFSDPIYASLLPSTVYGINIAAFVVPFAMLAVLILICIFILAIGVLLVVIIIVIIILAKKQRKYTLAEAEREAILNDLVSKEFRIEEEKLDFSDSIAIGSGASGSVFTAKYFNIEVAVKMVKKSSMGMENDLSDFYNELKFLNSNAQHENIIRFFGAYESESKNAVGLVMEFCANGNVSGYISKKVLNFEEKLDLIIGIANGMQYLHHFNIAHRDLKCENVLLNSELIPKIIDFGFSREIMEDANRSLQLTMNIGTAAYCAPEVLRMQVSEPLQMETSSVTTPNTSGSGQLKTDGESSKESNSTNDLSLKRLAYDKKCDVYSFAIVIFVIYFQNKLPYGATADSQILFQICKNLDFRPKFDEAKVLENEKWLIHLMKQCWSSDPDQRPSFEEICEALNSHRK